MSDRSAHGLGRAELHELYRALRLTRSAEERLEVLQKQGHVSGGVYRSLGQEAGAVGAAFALRRREDGRGDVLAPTVRAAGAVFLFGGSLEDFFRQYMAKGTGPTRGKEANVHWVDFGKGILGPVSPLGTMIEVMAGVTLAFRMRDEERIGMVFYGDGASSTGAWHEGLNFAAVQRCPLILMVEHNQWAFSTPTRKNTRVSSFTEKGPGYGIGAESVDGTDVLAVFDAVRRAAALARSGGGVRMVELRYFRRLGHAQHDPQDYVDPTLIAEWEKKDPIDRYRSRLLRNDWATEGELDAIDEEVGQRCRRAAEMVVEEPGPDPEAAVTDVYTDVSLPLPWTRLETPDPAGGRS
ncbi:MAG: thiamine pyrophosphate-dependent dehydrogenase E1 component subunit alpha [Longimicrobiales bacterium]|nr:thiamine pyrophosphate-dependent dehydrogenase E1 component subunit alpha [Longimicrobiales bacterium]